MYHPFLKDSEDLKNTRQPDSKYMYIPMPENPRRFSMTYKERTANVYVPMEMKLCHKLGVTRSELHMLGVKHINNLLQNQKIENQKLDLQLV